MVPLRLTIDDAADHEVILWQNNRCSSTRFCRPIRFQFARETTELAQAEKKYIEDQIAQLVPTKYPMGNKNIEVSHSMLFTMIDGKICNAITETTSTQRCYLCGLTSKDFNDMDKVLHVEVNKQRFEFGLSILHAWIRFLESILHLAYKLPLQKWQARGTQDKQVVAETKKKIQMKFKQELGIIVDKPKQGYGSTNDGNTARRFFHNFENAAEITGISVELIRRLNIILQTLSSGHLIDTEKFRKYTLDTALLYIEKYAWYPMTPTLHKILIHGPDVIATSILPIGQLSEEAQEASNKVFKRFREDYSRKISREKTNEDVLNRLLIASDPFISSMEDTQKSRKTVDKEVLYLIVPPNISFTSDIETEADDDSPSE